MVAVWAVTVELSLVSTPGTRLNPWSPHSWPQQVGEAATDNKQHYRQLEDDELLAAPRAAAVPDPGGAGRALHQPQGGFLAGPVRHPATAICGKVPEYWSET